MTGAVRVDGPSSNSAHCFRAFCNMVFPNVITDATGFSEFIAAECR